MKKEIKTVEKHIYIARDGKEFDKEEDCLQYEVFLDNEEEYAKAKEHIEALEIIYDKKEMPGVIPLDVFVEEEGNIGDIKRKLHKDSWNGHRYRYFRLNSKTDAEMLAKVMIHDGAKANIKEIISKCGKMDFPCIALYSDDYGWGREIGTFNKEMELIKKYCKLHGYRIKLEKIKEKG